jgi:hypothetical protein
MHALENRRRKISGLWGRMICVCKEFRQLRLEELADEYAADLFDELVAVGFVPTSD